MKKGKYIIIESNEKKKIDKMSIFVIGLGIVALLILIGGSYAVFQITQRGEKEQSLVAGILSIDLEDGNVITMENTYPMSDSEGMKQDSYSFSIENTGTVDAKYDVSLEGLVDKNTVNPKYVKYSLKEGEEDWSTPALLSTLDSSYNLVKNKNLEAEETISYELKLWIDYDAGNEVAGKTFQGRVVVSAVQNTGETLDVTAPLIKLNGELSMNVEQNTTFEDPGVESVSDDKDTLSVDNITKTYEYYDGEATVEVDSVDTSKLGVYYIYYKITDSNNNEGIVVRSINVYKPDTTPPVITLNGDSVVEYEVGSSYEELGATATDEGIDISKNIVIVGVVNTNRLGTYEIKYLIEDESGNTASVVRIVTVGGINIEVDTINIDLGENNTYQINASSDTGDSLSYVSEDEEILTVDENGLITAKAIGKTNVVLTASNGATETILVSVEKSVKVTYTKQGSGVTGIGKSEDSCKLTVDNPDSCEVEAPTITVESGYTVIGWNTDKDATEGTTVGETITLSADATYYAISYKNSITYTATFYKNGAVSQTDTSGEESTADTVTRSCIIPEAYNDNAQETSCSVTSPTIVASSNTPTITGYSTAATTYTSSWSHNATKAISSDVIYYAQTTKTKVTKNVTYSKSSGVSAIGKTSDSCEIAATYNGTEQSGSCTVTLPTMTSASGYNTGFWSTSSTATSGTAAGQSVSLSSSTTTYYAKALDTTKPVCAISGSKYSIDIGTTTSFTVKCTDTSNTIPKTTLSTSSFASNSTSYLTVSSVSSPTAITNGYQYTVSVKGVAAGSTTFYIKAGVISDISGNTNAKVTSSTIKVTIAEKLSISSSKSKGDYQSCVSTLWYDNLYKFTITATKYGVASGKMCYAETSSSVTSYCGSYAKNTNTGFGVACFNSSTSWTFYRSGYCAYAQVCNTNGTCTSKVQC